MTARRLLLPSALVLLSAASASAAPRMISYGYNSCVSCHLSVQGRGLLNAYGRGIDMAQSYSKKDFTAMLLGRPSGHEDTSQNWDGRFANVLLDFLASFRASHRFDEEKTDPGFFGVYRQAIFLGDGDRFRIHTEVGVLDGGLHDVSLGPALTSTGGHVVFLRKAVLEWRLSENDSTSGHELVFGRDYLPLGLQIDDHLAYILHLNRAGIYDYPLQLKYFAWNEKSLGSAFVFGPSFEEGAG
ncbi:MAG TPA: hypothetical protein VG095_00660, partial [Chthoniobacterales bacterium]|nr:hypothetical protein [Chthoniobacterales bacterium]